MGELSQLLGVYPHTAAVHLLTGASSSPSLLFGCTSMRSPDLPFVICPVLPFTSCSVEVWPLCEDLGTHPPLKLLPLLHSSYHWAWTRTGGASWLLNAILIILPSTS